MAAPNATQEAWVQALVQAQAVQTAQAQQAQWAQQGDVTQQAQFAAQYQQQRQQVHQQQQAFAAQGYAVPPNLAWQARTVAPPNLAWLAAPKKSAGDAGISGLNAVTTEALRPIAVLDTEWTLEDIAFKVCGLIGRPAAKYWNGGDERVTARATTVQAQAVIEEFTNALMSAISSGCGDKAWFAEANFTDPIFHAAMETFEGKNRNFLCRTVRPVLKKTIQDTVFKFREEDRVQKAIWDGVIISGLLDDQQQSAYKIIQGAYEEAYMTAPYGFHEVDPPCLGLVQDFVKGWMLLFIEKGFSVLESVSSEKEEQYAFLTTLFQYLTDPDQCCLPYELVSQKGAQPPDNWPFVAELAMTVLKAP